MKEYFTIQSKTSKDKILNLFQEHEIERKENNNGKADLYAQNTIINNLIGAADLDYYECLTTPDFLKHLWLPYHHHKDKDPNAMVPEIGIQLIAFAKHYKTLKSGGSNIKDCEKKVLDVKRAFFNAPVDTFSANFLLISNDGDTVHPRNYEGSFLNDLFIANGFHRLAAYALTLEEKGEFIPLKVYYGHNNKLVNQSIQLLIP